jgi:hypothetical protein
MSPTPRNTKRRFADDGCPFVSIFLVSFLVHYHSLCIPFQIVRILQSLDFLIQCKKNNKKHIPKLRAIPNPQILRVAFARSADHFLRCCFRAKRGDNFDSAFARNAEKMFTSLSCEARIIFCTSLSREARRLFFDRAKCG